MQIIKDKIIVEDSWQHLDDDATIVAGNMTVSLARWVAEREQLLKHDSEIGVRVLGEDPIENLIEDLPQLAMIVVYFPVFTDGRGYSVARLLRDRYGYQGDIRAQGDVLHDQLFYMSKVGFSSFQLADSENLSDALRAFDDFSDNYQTTTVQPEPLYRRR